MALADIARSEKLDTKALAKMLNLKPQTLAAWRHHGRNGLPYNKVGRAVRYDLREVQQWLDSRTGTSTTELAALA